jgi:SAM-dependent methyltransferase
LDAIDWDERYRATDRLWSAEPNVFVADRLGGMRPGRGLDLASGEGRNAIWLAGEGWDMTAVDFSEAAIERGRRISDEVRWVVADVRVWEPGDEYDLIVVAYLQLSIDELEPLVRRAVTWLAPGGELFMVGHERSNLEHGVGGPQVPEVLWDLEELVPWLDGLDILEAEIVEREVVGETGTRVALDALVRARRV